jgi:hypothetical protein
MRTIFWPPGPVPLRYETVRSVSLIFNRGGNGLSVRWEEVEKHLSATGLVYEVRLRRMRVRSSMVHGGYYLVSTLTFG